MSETNGETGTLYGVGIGPGDPQLVTLASVDLIKRCPLVLCPRGANATRSVAREILASLIPAARNLEEIEFPMTRNRHKRRSAYLEVAARFAGHLTGGEDIAFVTIGDPGIYSTFVYFAEALRSLVPRCRVETLPGVSAIQFTASRLGISLAQGDERFAVVPLPDPVDGLDSMIAEFDTVVIMKIGRRFSDLHRYITDRNLLAVTGLVAHAGRPDEVIRKRLESDDATIPGYLATVVIQGHRNGNRRSTT